MRGWPEAIRHSRRQDADPLGWWCSSTENNPCAVWEAYVLGICLIPDRLSAQRTGVAAEPGGAFTTGEQLHSATGIASNAGCGAGGAAAGAAAAVLSSVSRCWLGGRVIARMR